jgi:hypothetical protein
VVRSSLPIKEFQSASNMHGPMQRLWADYNLLAHRIEKKLRGSLPSRNAILADPDGRQLAMVAA